VPRCDRCGDRERFDPPAFKKQTVINVFSEMLGIFGLPQSQQPQASDGKTHYCERRLLVQEGSVDNIVRLQDFSAAGFRDIVQAWIPESITVLPPKHFAGFVRFQSISFEINSRLTRIESNAFSNSLLQSIMIPRSVEILGSSCFYWCKSLSSITFESDSRLIGIESFAFSESSLQLIVIPSTILFIAYDAVFTSLQVSLFEGNSCPEFNRWLDVSRLGIAIDFRRVLKINSGLRELRDYMVNVSGFEERSIICESDRILKKLCCLAEDGVLLVVKSNWLPD
jgi:hypothetical protein